MFKLSQVAIALTGLSTLAIAVKVLAQPGNLPKVVVASSSFVSPLVDLFGEVSVGEKSFVAGNTILRAEPGAKICISNETNLQDNIHFIALRNAPAPTSNCGAKSSSTQNRVSIAHQAVIKNSTLGNFVFVGFRSRITNSTLEDGVFVLHGATVTGVTIPKDRIVPIGAKITTQAQANALKPKAEANSEF